MQLPPIMLYTLMQMPVLPGYRVFLLHSLLLSSGLTWTIQETSIKEYTGQIMDQTKEGFLLKRIIPYLFMTKILTSGIHITRYLFIHGRTWLLYIMARDCLFISMV